MRPARQGSTLAQQHRLSQLGRASALHRPLCRGAASSHEGAQGALVIISSKQRRLTCKPHPAPPQSAQHRMLLSLCSGRLLAQPGHAQPPLVDGQPIGRLCGPQRPAEARQPLRGTSLCGIQGAPAEYSAIVCHDTAASSHAATTTTGGPTGDHQDTATASIRCPLRAGWRWTTPLLHYMMSVLLHWLGCTPMCGAFLRPSSQVVPGWPFRVALGAEVTARRG
jgi:hypothetical protein